MAEHNVFGKFGEQFAVAYLLQNGYKIHHRNYSYLKAEIDIIAEKSNTLIIVEVKARSTTFKATMADMIPKKKIKLLVLAADHYVRTNAIDLELRFDVITVFKTAEGFQLEHVKDAFYHF